MGSIAKGGLVLTAACFGALTASITTARATPKRLELVPHAAIPHDHTLRVVAEGGPQLALHSAGGRIVVSSGYATYTAQRDGRLERNQETAAYASLFDTSQAALVGFLAPTRSVRRVAPDPTGDVVHWVYDAPFYQPQLTRLPRSGKASTIELTDVMVDAMVVWNGVAVGIAYDVTTGERMWSASGPAPIVHEKAPDFVVVGRDNALVGGETNGRATIWKKPTDEPVVIASPKEAPHECRFVSSFDGDVYQRCGFRLYVLAKNERWDLVSEDVLVEYVSIAEDGSLFLASESARAVEHCSRDKKTCKKLTFEADASTDEMAWWESYATDVQERNGDRQWTTATVHRSEPTALTTIRALYARSEDDVWVLAGTTGPEMAVLHSGPERTRIRLPTRDEIPVLVKNDAPPTSWAGHCDEVFVELDGATRDDVERVVGEGLGFHWDVVEGRLHGRPVRGVVFLRAAADASLAKMEERIEQVRAHFTKSPAREPLATCTLPVLDRLL